MAGHACTPAGGRSLPWACHAACLTHCIHACAADWLPISIPNKVLSDLIISNESRVASSSEVVYYNRSLLRIISMANTTGLPAMRDGGPTLWCRMRAFHFTAKIRYEVGNQCACLPTQLSQYHTCGSGDAAAQ